MKTQLDGDVPTVPFISIIYREHAKYLNEKVKDEDLSFGLFPLLIKIYKNEGIIQEQLAQSFHLNESTITRNLKKLEDKGFIERSTHIVITVHGMTSIPIPGIIPEKRDSAMRFAQLCPSFLFSVEITAYLAIRAAASSSVRVFCTSRQQLSTTRQKYRGPLVVMPSYCMV